MGFFFKGEKYLSKAEQPGSARIHEERKIEMLGI